VLLSPPGDYARLLTQEGFRWIGFRSRGRQSVVRMAALWRLIELYRRERPDLAHHFTIKCVLYGGIAAHCSRARAIVSSVTGLGHVFITDSWRNRLSPAFGVPGFRFVFRRSQIIFQNPMTGANSFALPWLKKAEAI